MPGVSFIDSNVLLYLADQDAVKSDRARVIIGAGGVISVQVLNEFANVARRKLGRSWGHVRENIWQLRELLAIKPITIDDHDLGRDLAERYRLAFYDAVIAASALNAGCERLWTEDMHDGLVLDGRLRIANPFTA